MEKNPGKLIFTAYQDEGNNIRLGISPEFDGYTNGKDYFINLGDLLIKMTFESAKKLDVISSNIQEKNNE